MYFQDQWVNTPWFRCYEHYADSHIFDGIIHSIDLCHFTIMIIQTLILIQTDYLPLHLRRFVITFISPFNFSFFVQQLLFCFL